MAPRSHCRVCAHPKAVDINRDLAAGKSVRDIAGRYSGLSKSRVQEHKTGCVAPMVGGPEALSRIQQDTVQAAAGREQAAHTIQGVVEQQRESAAELNRANQRFRATVQKITMDLVNALAGRKDDPEAPIEVDKARTLIEALRVAVQASDSIEGGIELGGKLSGELATGSQVNVQVNVALQGALQRVGEENGRWLTEDAPAAVRAGLAELGVTGSALERGTAAVVRHLVAGRAGLGARIAVVLDQEAGA